MSDTSTYGSRRIIECELLALNLRHGFLVHPELEMIVESEAVVLLCLTIQRDDDAVPVEAEPELLGGADRIVNAPDRWDLSTFRTRSNSIC